MDHVHDRGHFIAAQQDRSNSNRDENCPFEMAIVDVIINHSHLHDNIVNVTFKLQYKIFDIMPFESDHLLFYQICDCWK